MANITFKLDADEANAVQGFLRLVEAQKKTEDGFKRVTTAHKNGAAEMFEDLGKVAAGFATITTAIDATRKAWDAFQREREAGMARLAENESTGSRLAQLAGSPQELKGMLASAELSSKQGGMPLGEAQRLQFEIESAGITETRQMFAELSGIIEQPAEIAKAIVVARNALGKKARGVRQTLNEAKIASGPETIDLDEVLLNVAGIAPGIAQLGGTQEEAFSALAMLSGARKDPVQAATEIRSFVSQAMRKGYGGKGLFGAIERFQVATAGKSDKAMQKIFADQEALRGFQTLAPRLGELRQRAEEMEKGGVEGPDDEVARMLALRSALPELGTPHALRRVKEAVESEQKRRYGFDASESELAARAVELESLRRGDSSGRRFFGNVATGAAAKLGADPETVLAIGAGTLDPSRSGKSNQMEQLQVLRDIYKELKNQRTANRNNGIE